MMRIEKYGLFETKIKNTTGAALVEDCAVFTNGETQYCIPAFKNGDDSIVRFMPQKTGTWEYTITLCGQEICGTFECVENTGNNHGPVVTEADHFRYADGATYIPFGTTCYAWIHQTAQLQQQTLDTLGAAPFNKIRMCVFPKSMPYNNNDPDCYPFFKKEDNSWDVTRPDPVFWEKLDQRIKELMDLGIEADLIVFHPYDRWGFSELSQEDSLTYLNYCIARLSAYRNLWWSLANEYEMLFAKTISDWDAYGELIKEKDLYGHLISVHNIISPYPKRPWLTHCSIQSGAIDKILLWRQSYGIPVIIDECGYEGDLAFDWGSLTAYEMVHRFWWSVCRGGFCTHGETYHRTDEVLWWAKGGVLYGESPKRIAFMKELLYSLPGPWHMPEGAAGNPNEGAADAQAAEGAQASGGAQASESAQDAEGALESEGASASEGAQQSEDAQNFLNVLLNAPKDDRDTVIANLSPLMLRGDGYFLRYFGRMRPAFTELALEGDKKFRVEIIDIWEMTRKLAAEGVCGSVKIGLPAKEGIAILVMQMDE